MLFSELRQICCQKADDRKKKKDDCALIDPCRRRNTEYVRTPEEQLHNNSKKVKDHGNPETDLVKSSQ